MRRSQQIDHVPTLQSNHQLARWAGGVNYLMDELGAMAILAIGEGDDDDETGALLSGRSGPKR